MRWRVNEPDGVVEDEDGHNECREGRTGAGKVAQNLRHAGSEHGGGERPGVGGSARANLMEAEWTGAYEIKVRVTTREIVAPFLKWASSAGYSGSYHDPGRYRPHNHCAGCQVFQRSFSCGCALRLHARQWNTATRGI